MDRCVAVSDMLIVLMIWTCKNPPILPFRIKPITACKKRQAVGLYKPMVPCVRLGIFFLPV